MRRGTLNLVMLCIVSSESRVISHREATVSHLVRIVGVKRQTVGLEGRFCRTGSKQVERFAPRSLLRRSSKVIGPGLGRDVDLRRLASELRGIDSAHHLEFLESVDGRDPDIQVEIGIGVGNPSNVQLSHVPRIPTTEIF